MSIYKKARFIVLFLLITSVLSGCFWQDHTVEKMYDVMEDVVDKEKGFEDQQDPLVKLEMDEQELFNQILALGSKEHEQILKLSDEALNLVAKRKKAMEKEQKSLDASKEEFEKVLPLIEELEDQELKNQANELTEIMSNRYEVHNRLYDIYLQGIECDIELYKLLKGKELSGLKLDEQITKINEAYKDLASETEKFNELTEKYNDAKLSFYKKAGLSIKTK